MALLIGRVVCYASHVYETFAKFANMWVYVQLALHSSEQEIWGKNQIEPRAQSPEPRAEAEIRRSQSCSEGNG